MGIEPDLKDWTWVLDQPCPDCGFEAGALAVEDVPRRVRELVPLWRAVLASPVARTRPDESTWSPTEYACHVRDVCELFADRIELMLDQEDPEFESWDQDVTAVEERYDLQESRVVADQLADGAERIAAAIESVPEGAWDRTGRRSNGSVFTVQTLVEYFLHDVEHHAWDVSYAH